MFPKYPLISFPLLEELYSKLMPKLPKSNKIILPLITSLILGSCGGGDNSNNLGALKQKQADLKTELANLAAQISKLEGDSANKFVLVDAAQVPMQIFKTYINAFSL